MTTELRTETATDRNTGKSPLTPIETKKVHTALSKLSKVLTPKKIEAMGNAPVPDRLSAYAQGRIYVRAHTRIHRGWDERTAAQRMKYTIRYAVKVSGSIEAAALVIGTSKRTVWKLV